MEYLIYNIENLTSEEYDKWFSHMSEEKQKKVSRFKNIDRKKCSVAGEKLVKEFISNALTLAPEDIAILIDRNGKPYIENCPIHFNISHCENIIACAFSEKEIGIDIEKIKPIPLNVLKRFFSEKEQEFVLGKTQNDDFSTGYNTPEILERFYKIYTLKEAICKKSGVGIKGLKSADAFPLLDHSFIENDFIISIV